MRTGTRAHTGTVLRLAVWVLRLKMLQLPFLFSLPYLVCLVLLIMMLLIKRRGRRVSCTTTTTTTTAATPTKRANIQTFTKKDRVGATQRLLKVLRGLAQATRRIARARACTAASATTAYARTPTPTPVTAVSTRRWTEPARAERGRRRPTASSHAVQIIYRPKGRMCMSYIPSSSSLPSLRVLVVTV